MLVEEYREIVILNNQGVVLVENAQHDDARNRFERALNLMARTIELSYQKMRPNTMPQNIPYRGVLHRWSCASSGGTAVERIDSVSGSFVYRRALFIEDYSDHPSSDYREEAMILIYNFALSLHLMGLETNSSMILRAISLYKINCNILPGDYQNLGSSRSTLLRDPMFRAAVISNMGSASFEMADFQSGSYYFEELVQELCNSNLAMDARSAPFAKDVQGFLINSAMERPTAAPSA